jgi:hypothetical protein
MSQGTLSRTYLQFTDFDGFDFDIDLYFRKSK